MEAGLGRDMSLLIRHRVTVLAVVAACVVLIAIVVGAGESSKKPATPAPSPVDVEIVQVLQRDVPIYGEWIGTLDGMVNADIKAQVQGYVLNRTYQEGSYVRKGDLLFEIDPRPFQAALEQASGQLSQTKGQVQQAMALLSEARARLTQAEANQVKTQLDVDRYTPLARQGVIPQQDLDNAVQANLASKAQVNAAKAAVETAEAGVAAARATAQSAEAGVKNAELNLGFTKVVSPVDGIAGIAQAQVGNLVNPTSGSLTTVSTLDPIKVYFTVTEQEYLNYVRQNPGEADRRVAEKLIELELVLADGTTYPQKGKFFVADRSVDQKTGAIRLAALFPNPGNKLRPGQYGRVRAITARRLGSLLVPQRAVTELQGAYQVAVVGNDNKVDIRRIKVGERVDSMWIVTDGLAPGDGVIAEGLQKVRPGSEVRHRPFLGSAVRERP